MISYINKNDKLCKFSFSVSVCNVFRERGIKTVGQLLAIPRDEIILLNNIGSKRRREIVDFIISCGVNFKEEDYLTRDEIKAKIRYLISKL